MAVTSTVSPAVVQMGRGVAFPFRFSGGVAWNVPKRPTDAEARAAANGGMQAVCTIGIGDFWTRRGDGTLLRAMRFGNGSQAQLDQNDSVTKASISAALPWLAIRAVRTTRGASDDTTNTAISYWFRNANRNDPKQLRSGSVNV